MNKIRQNKITFTLILTAIGIIFSSLTILSLPVLFNYKSKVALIEKNFFKSFKIYLNSSGNISYKPFPKPHLVVENATLNLIKSQKKDDLISTSNLKIFISLRDIYLRSFNNLIYTEISDSNIALKISDFKELRTHLYQKINKPIIFNNCKIFLRNKKKEVILISPVKKISYKINNKKKIKNLAIDGQLFGLNFKSRWKRSYETPKKSLHQINIFNPNIEIKNNFEFINEKKFTGWTEILFPQDKLRYNFQFEDDKININSPNDENINFDLKSMIQLKPFYFDGQIIIKNKKIENIIDYLLINALNYNKDYIGNFNGNLKIKFNDLKNKLIKNGQIEFLINENKLVVYHVNFMLDKIGEINSSIKVKEDMGVIKFFSSNKLKILNHIEFAKVFQVGSKKVKNIKEIYFDLEKNIGETDFIITNVKIDNKAKILKEIFLIKNIQNLRSYIRKIID